MHDIKKNVGEVELFRGSFFVALLSISVLLTLTWLCSAFFKHVVKIDMYDIEKQSSHTFKNKNCSLMGNQNSKKVMKLKIYTSFLIFFPIFISVH